MPKLKHLFQDAVKAAASGIEVDWNLQPLPQKLILDDKSHLIHGRPPSAVAGLAIAALKPTGKAATSLPQSPPESESMSSDQEIRNCGGISHAEAHRELTCAHPDCKIGRYHDGCVGLAKRPHGPAWLCFACRPHPPSLIPNGQASVGPPEPPLSAQQRAVVDLIVHGGKNVCYTESAGTGKSMVLKAAVAELRRQDKRVDIVAPSGIAALAVNGQTVFVYAGWIPDSFKMGIKEIGDRARGEKIRRRLCKTDILIIEEISMIDSHLFERLDLSCREAAAAASRKEAISLYRRYDPSLPFGGMQVIVTGDFCQLPPVRPFDMDYGPNMIVQELLATFKPAATLIGG